MRPGKTHRHGVTEDEAYAPVRNASATPGMSPGAEMLLRGQTAGGNQMVVRSLTATPLTVQRERDYSAGEIDQQRRGVIRAGADDGAIASQLGLVDGDIAFRLGSRVLADLIDNPVTHGGVYVGGGLIHDMVGFGNRTTRLSWFYEESVDGSMVEAHVKVIRFTGPHADLIVPRVVANIRRGDFRLPTDPKPWNLFSSADDSRTMTCLEYAHAQYLYAIKQLSTDQAVDETTRANIRSVYFAPDAAEPNMLATPQTISSSHRVGSVSLASMMMHAANTGGTNIDPSRYENRWEGTSEIRNYGPPPDSWLSWILPPNLVEVDEFRTFTYRSFADSRRFFSVIR